MRINFIGLSSFLIENRAGFRVLIDPFNDAPEWSLGPRFPTEFGGKPFGANIVLMSEPDADHAYAPGGWLQHAPPTKPHQDPFPGLDLRGTVIYEFNGDLNIAWHYTVDGIRCAHLADNAHPLSETQLSELGRPDVLFISPPKTPPDNKKALDVIEGNISALRPKIVIWAHYPAPAGMPRAAASLRSFFLDYFEKQSATNKNYEGPEGFMTLYNVFVNGMALNENYSGELIDVPTLDVDDALLEKGKDGPHAVLFRAMLAKP